MKKLFTIILSSLFCLSLAAQEQKIKIADLYTPLAPGLVLMDKAPSSIEKPATPRAFGVALLNLWQGGAVSATPFWFNKKPNLTYEEFMKRKMPVIETFNISLATFKTDTSTAWSVGFRTHLLRSYSKGRLNELSKVKGELQLLLADLVGEDGEVDKKVEAAINKKVTELGNLRKRGYVAVELAGAMVGTSADNSFKNLSSNRSGFWANIRWMPEKTNLDFVALTRYLWSVNSLAKSGRDSAFFDYGIALSYQSDRVDIAFEYVNRNDFSLKKNYDRLALNANFMLNENLIIEVAIGKNFGKVDNIISVFGMKFALEGKSIKAL